MGNYVFGFRNSEVQCSIHKKFLMITMMSRINQNPLLRPISLKSIPVFSHLRLGIPKVPFPVGLAFKVQKTPLNFILATCCAYLNILVILIIQNI